MSSRVNPNALRSDHDEGDQTLASVWQLSQASSTEGLAGEDSPAQGLARDAACGVGRVEQGRYVTPGTAVVILLILAALASSMRDPGMLPAILFAAAAAVAVGARYYLKRYSAVQRDPIESPQPASPLTQDRRNGTLMRATPPSWRRWAGYSAIVIGAVLPWSLLPSDKSGWLLLVIPILSFASIGASAWLTDWLWKPYREEQQEARQTRVEQR